jgi:hydroxymethylpyrimidine pyrophosphatase-like HAD family hydrolase
VVVFGDSYNDLSMFKESGLNIAVRNSYPEVLKKADIITDENYNSGLGKAIYKYVLKK